MSDTSQGEGWWQASDGKWYPPTAQPGTAQQQPVQPVQPQPVQQPQAVRPEPFTAQPAVQPASAPVAPAGTSGPAKQSVMQQPYMKAAVIGLVVVALVFVAGAVLLRSSGGNSVEDQVRAAFDESSESQSKRECKSFMADISSEDEIDQVFDAFSKSDQQSFIVAQRDNPLFADADFKDLDFEDFRAATHALYEECDSRGYN